MMKNNLKNKTTKQQKNTGITLIALVVTIIVLLILAGVSIMMLSGNNGILNRAAEAKEATRGSEVQETVRLEAINNTTSDYIGGEKKSRAKVIEELHDMEKLTNDEVDMLTDEENPVDVITIGGITIDFSVLGSAGSKTLGEVYGSDLKIGDKLTYSSNGQSSWIVFGKDTNGNILITTELPIENGFNLKGGAEAWLKYESDTDSEYGLNKACSTYGGTIQGKQVKSRSIKMEDINYVAGLKPKTETVDENTYNIQSFDTYTFGSDAYNATNKTANYWYPVLSGETGPTGTGTGFWQDPSKKSETFKNDWYGYYCKRDDGKYYYYGADTNGEEISAADAGLNTDNLKYIWGGKTGETCYKVYLVASRSVYIRSDNAYFNVALVGSGAVRASSCTLCRSDSRVGFAYGDIGSFGIRPVVILPSSLLVEEQEGGTYDLAE